MFTNHSPAHSLLARRNEPHRLVGEHSTQVTQLEDGGTYLNRMGTVVVVALRFPNTAFPFQDCSAKYATRFNNAGTLTQGDERSIVASSPYLHELVRKVPTGTVMHNWAVSVWTEGSGGVSVPSIELVCAITSVEALTGHSRVGTLPDSIQDMHAADAYLKERYQAADVYLLDSPDFKIVV